MQDSFINGINKLSPSLYNSRCPLTSDYFTRESFYEYAYFTDGKTETKSDLMKLIKQVNLRGWEKEPSLPTPVRQE